MDDEEKVGRELDEFLNKVWRRILEDEAGVHVLDPKRMKEFIACGEAMKHLFPETGTKIKITPHDMFPNIGTIEVSAKELKVRDTARFVKALSKASNYEIYPKLNGDIVLAIVFYGITRNK